MKPKAALVVAHPDDESLWFAGYVLTHPYDWTIICCSIPRMDPLRAWKFYDACEVLGAKAKVLPFVESPPSHPLIGLDALSLADFDCAVTHGAMPEPGYGHQHLHHAQVHRHIMDKWAGRLRVTTLGDDGVIELDNVQLARKTKALHCYNHALPYNGHLWPKWRALVHRYCEAGGYDLRCEGYNAAVA